MTKKYHDKYDLHYLLIDISCQFNDVDETIKIDNLPAFLDSFYYVMAKTPDNRCRSAGGISRCPNLRKD